MTSMRETHNEFVKELLCDTEPVLQPKHGTPIGTIIGYIKTQNPLKDAGYIFRDQSGQFGIFGDCGEINICGIEWNDLGLCDARCWYEWMDDDH